MAFLLVSAQAYKQNMLKFNKTPKDRGTQVTSSAVCEECKVIVTRFAKAIEDPTKMAELKAILRMLCHETSYVEECKMFVNRLDYFIAHIEPYLKDPESACKHLRMCGNKKIETFHKISVVYMQRFRDGQYVNNDLICEECQFAASELKSLVEEEKSQQKIKTFLSEEVCRRLGKYQGSCDLMLDEFLPSLFEELDKMLANSKQFCTDLGLCKAVSFDGMESEEADSNDQQVSVFSRFNF